MATEILHSRVWALVRRQHYVVTRHQLLALGFTEAAIRHRLATGRLHVVHRGVYAVGRPELTREGRFMAAVLACGEGAALSHDAAGAHLGIRRDPRVIEVSVPAARCARRPGIRVHRRAHDDVTRRRGVPVTTPIATLVDLATCLEDDPLEAAVNEADILGLCTPECIRRALDRMPARPGAARLQRLLDRHTFRLTRSKLERLFLRLAKKAGLPPPLTRQIVNGYEVDFYWPDLRLVVETDGLSYHRTPAKQAADLMRDQAHAAAGLRSLRFSHYQVAREPEHVTATLRAVA